MSVSAWETRSATSAVSMDDRRARLAAYHLQQQQQQQQQAPPPPPPQYSSDHRSASPSRHQSFPAPPPPQAHKGHHGHRPHDSQQRRQNQMPSPQQHQQRDMRGQPAPLQQSGFRDQVPPYAGQRHASPSPQQLQRKHYSPSPQRTQRKQFKPTTPERPNGRPQYERHASMGSLRHHEFSSPPPPPLRKISEDSRLQHSQRSASGHEERPYPPSSSNPPHPRNQVERAFPEPLPPPPPVRRGAGGATPPGPIPIELPDQPVRQTTLPSATSSADDEPANIDDVLLGKQWSVHVISHMYQFQRHELSDYANELVKFLRGHAVMTFEQEFGYSVMIRFTSECVAFNVVEARDIHAEFLLEKAEQPERAKPPQPQKPELEDNQESNDPDDLRQRAGSFVVYFPKSAEDAGVRRGPLAGNSGGPGAHHRRGRLQSGDARSNENGSDGNGGVTTATARVDPKYVFLLRGNEELMAWVGSWLQRRFQCVIGVHVVRVTEENLRRVTRNWVIEALEREVKAEKARQRKAERLRKASARSGGDDDHKTRPNGHAPLATTTTATTAWPTRAPLLLKYRAKAETDVVKAYTMTMPWASVRRVHALMDGGVGSALGTVPEVIERLEHLYFGNLQKDVASMTLMGVQMEEVEVDTRGKVKFFKSTMVQSILQSFLDIFVVQQVAAPTEPVTTL